MEWTTSALETLAFGNFLIIALALVSILLVDCDFIIVRDVVQVHAACRFLCSNVHCQGTELEVAELGAGDIGNNRRIRFALLAEMAMRELARDVAKRSSFHIKSMSAFVNLTIRPYLPKYSSSISRFNIGNENYAAIYYFTHIQKPSVMRASMIYYADFEHPNVTYFNPKYFEYLKITAQRYSRRDPIHYLNYRLKILTVFGNDIVFSVNIYEFLSNEYRPSMFVMRFRLCDWFTEPKYAMFKPFYLKFFNASSCPFPKGEYNFMNYSIPNLPLLSTFPLQKGRLFARMERGGERVVEVYIDAVIKQKFL